MGVGNIIEVKGLRKSYKEVKAVKNISFFVRENEIFGFLGPNGAGKTTTLSILEGILSYDMGEVLLFQKDIRRHSRQIKQRIGVQLQHTSLIYDLTCIEQLMLFGSLYGKKIDRVRAAGLLRDVGLTLYENKSPEKLSGGQQTRLTFALALVNDPDIVFLDEPTSGLDPQSRRMVWELILSLKKTGKTIVVTTHFIEEAEFLCDRVAIIDQGNIVAAGTPIHLISQLDNISSIMTAAIFPDDMESSVAYLVGVDRQDNMTRLYTKDVVKTLESLIQYAKEKDLLIQDLRIKQPNLEDYFLKVTGHTIRE